MTTKAIKAVNTKEMNIPSQNVKFSFQNQPKIKRKKKT